MPLPTSYTHDALAAYMRDGVLGATGAVLGLTALEQYDEAVNNVAILLDVSDLATVSDLGLVRAYARHEAWCLACATAAGDYSYSSAGESNQRSQVYDHCLLQRNAAAMALATIIGTRTGYGAAWRGHRPIQVTW